MNNNLTFLISFIFLASCSVEESIQQEPDILDDIYFTEFMPCKAGPDFNAENMTAMISEWQKLITAEELLGVWGYAPVDFLDWSASVNHQQPFDIDLEV